MRIKYQGPFVDGVEIPTLNNLVCPQGQPVDVPTDIAKRLLGQGSHLDDDGKTVPAEHPNWVKTTKTKDGK